MIKKLFGIILNAKRKKNEDKQTFYNLTQIPKTLPLEEIKEKTNFSKEQMEEFFKIIDAEQLINAELVHISFKHEKVYDFTGEEIKLSGIQLQIRKRLVHMDYKKEMYGKTLETIRKNTDPHFRVANKRFERYLVEKKKAERESNFEKLNLIYIEQEILMLYKDEIRKHFKEKLQRR